MPNRHAIFLTSMIASACTTAPAKRPPPPETAPEAIAVPPPTPAASTRPKPDTDDGPVDEKAQYLDELAHQLDEWTRAHPEIQILTRLRLIAPFDYELVATVTDVTQCLRKRGTEPIVACWRTPHEHGYLPGVEIAGWHTDAAPDGGTRLSGFLQPAPGVRWAVHFPPATFAPVANKNTPTAPFRPIAEVPPPDLGPLRDTLIEWSDHVRRLQTPYGEAWCRPTAGGLACEIPGD